MRQPAGARDWRGPDLDSAVDINDPWGRRTLYRTPGESGSFDILTYGRDGGARR